MEERLHDPNGIVSVVEGSQQVLPGVRRQQPISAHVDPTSALRKATARRIEEPAVDNVAEVSEI